MAYNRYAAVSDEARNVEIARIATVDEERDLQGRRIPGRVCVVGSGAPYYPLRGRYQRWATPFAASA